MTATIQPESKPTSRRAVLAGVLAGVGGWAASTLVRASPVRAGVDGDLVLGTVNFAPTTTSIGSSSGSATFSSGAGGSGTGISGDSSTGIGVRGNSNSGIGVRGTSTSSDGVQGQSDSHSGVAGITDAPNWPAIGSWARGNSTGVLGYSGVALPLAAPPRTGVYGYAAQDATSVGVRGESPNGFGLYGKTTGTGFAGYFNGKTFMSQFVEIAEIATPAAPRTNRARLFVRDNGLGKTQLCVRFPTGAVKVLATEG